MRQQNVIDSGMSAPLKFVDVAVIGGGAAGLFGAAQAADYGLGALLIERKARPAAKMLMTANGRCNFTKDISSEQMLADIGAPVADFVREAIISLPPAKLMAGFKYLGLKVKRMQDGRIFPASEKAADVVHVLGDWLREKEVPLITNCPVTDIAPVKGGFQVATPNFSVGAKNVLIATGGVSFPKTGSVGDGQNFARKMGHALEPYRAGLTGFEVARLPAAFHPGERLENVEGRVIVQTKMVYRWRGELEVMRWGVSGAAVYNCQRYAARNGFTDWTFELMAGGTHLVLHNPTPRPIKEAIVTIGGVSRDDVNPKTMESLKVPGLYFAGEVLDIDGPTGGYNLTMAFATARLAAKAIAEKLKKGK